MTAHTSNLVFVDVEARGVSPVNGVMSEFGAVHYDTRETFHGRLYEGRPDPATPAVPVIGKKLVSETVLAEEFALWLAKVTPVRSVFVSDNPAWDFMWIAALFDMAQIQNPFGHSGRRISDFWAGLKKEWRRTQDWKSMRVTVHDHNPVNDAMGNVEAFEKILLIADIQNG